jgi:hypothetical protein
MPPHSTPYRTRVCRGHRPRTAMQMRSTIRDRCTDRVEVLPSLGRINVGSVESAVPLRQVLRICRRRSSESIPAQKWRFPVASQSWHWYHFPGSAAGMESNGAPVRCKYPVFISYAYLIVLCSPAAAQSRWVKQEIVEFKTARPGRSDPAADRGRRERPPRGPAAYSWHLMTRARPGRQHRKLYLWITRFSKGDRSPVSQFLRSTSSQAVRE